MTLGQPPQTTPLHPLLHVESLPQKIVYRTVVWHPVATSAAWAPENTALLLLRMFPSAGMCLPNRCLANELFWFSDIMSQYSIYFNAQIASF
jgi:hypothetical protein